MQRLIILILLLAVFVIMDRMHEARLTQLQAERAAVLKKLEGVISRNDRIINQIKNLRKSLNHER